MNKGIIFYVSKNGATKKSAEIISGILNQHYSIEITLEDSIFFDKNRDYSNYDYIFIGFGVKMGKWYNKGTKILKFFEKYKKSHQKFIIFISSGRIGYALLEKDQEKYDKAFSKFLLEKLLKFPNLTPIIAKNAFGGIYIKKSLNLWNKDRVETWSHEIGKQLNP